MFKLGDVVKMNDADEPGRIFAYRTMRGRVIDVSSSGAVRVDWYEGETGKKMGADWAHRKASDLVLAGEDSRVPPVS